MKAKVKIALFFIIVLAIALIGGIFYVWYVADTKQKAEQPEPTYQIVMKEEYDVFVGDSFALAPNIVNDKGEFIQGVFTYESDNKGVTVSPEGIVTIDPSATGVAHITIRDFKTGISTEVELRLANEVYGVYDITKADGTAIDAVEQYKYGESYSYKVTVIPEGAQLTQNTSVTCVSNGVNYPDALDVEVDGNDIKITPKAIGVGNFTVRIVNQQYGVDYSKEIQFDSSLEDEILTESVLSATTSGLVLTKDFEAINQIVFDETVEAVNLNEVEEYMPNVERIVFAAQSVVEVGSSIPDVCYRVPESTFKSYYFNEVWADKKESIIPYFESYDEVNIVYHTDEVHPAEQFDSDGLFVLKFDGEQLLECEYSGYTHVGWLNNNESITVADLVGEANGLHLYANWSTNRYTVTLEDYIEDELHTENATITVEYNSPVNSLSSQPIKTGWTFAGWYFEEDFTTPFTNDTIYTHTQGITVYAKYVTNISFDYDGLETSEDIDEINEVVYNFSITLPLYEDEERGGWKFGGWFTTASGYQGEQVLSGSEYNLERETQKLYARWYTDIEYEYDNAFSELNWQPYRYIHGLTVQQSNEETGASLFTADDFSAKYGSYGWELNELYIINDDRITVSNFIKFDVGDVIYLDIVSYVFIYYNHYAVSSTGQAQVLTEGIHYGGSLNLFRADWGTQSGAYSDESLIYDEGYTFKCIWDNGSDTEVLEGNGDIAVTFDLANSIYLIKYDAVEYTISLSKDGVIVDAITLTYTDLNREVNLPAFEGGLERVGYTGSWTYENKTVGDNLVWNIPTDLFKDITLNAVYTANRYKVTFIGYDGQSISKDGVVYYADVTYDETIANDHFTYVEILTAIPTGYSFIGWFTKEADGSYSKWNTDKIYEIAGDLELYARFSMEVTFEMYFSNIGGVPGSFEKSGTKLAYTVCYGESLPFPMELVDNGEVWQLLGWSSQNTFGAESSLEVVKDEENSKLSLTPSLTDAAIDCYTSSINTYYAVWGQDVSVSVPKGEQDIKPSYTTITVLYNVSSFNNLCEIYGINLFDESFFVKSAMGVNWRFDGYYLHGVTDGDLISTEENYFQNNSSFRIITIYAKFISKVTFVDADGVSSYTAEDIVLSGSLSGLFETVEGIIIVPNGYLRYWYLNDSNITSNEAIMLSLGNAEVHAKYEPIHYTVSYDSNDGSGEMESSDFTYDKAQALMENTFTKAGYHFLGWSNVKDAVTVIYEDKQSLINLTNVNGHNVDLYAVWEANTYTVKYDANGGDGEMEDSSFIYGEKYNLTANSYKKDGYNFLGWTDEKTATSVKYEDNKSVKNLTEENGGTVTLYAVWEANTFNVQYNFGVDNLSETVNVKYDNTTSSYPSVNRFGYTFNGWSADGETVYEAGEIIGNLTTENNATITLTAIWTADSFEIKYKASDLSDVGTAAFTLDDWSIANVEYQIEKVSESNTYIISINENYANAVCREISIYKPSTSFATAQEGYEYYWDLSSVSQIMLQCMANKFEGEPEFSTTLKYEPIAYTVSYIVGGESVKNFIYSVDDISNAQTWRANIEKNVPSVSVLGYKFISWNYDELPQGDTVQLGNYSVYATLEPIEYTLLLTNEKGEEMFSIYKYCISDDIVTLPNDSSAYELCKFYNWDISAQNITNKISALENGNKTITIVGELRTFMIEYVESGDVQTFTYTYNELEKVDGNYYFNLKTLTASGSYILTDRDYTNFNKLSVDGTKIPFNYEDLIVISLAEGEKLYVYDANGGIIYDSLSEQLFGKTFIITSEEPAIFNGGTGVYYDARTFEKWETSDGGELICLRTAVWKTESVIVDETYTIHFVTEPGLYQPNDITVKYGTLDVNLPEVAKTGYTFDGWYIGEEKFDFNVEQDVESVTLNGRWAPIKYTVVFGHGYTTEETENSIIVEYDQEIDLNNYNYSRDYYSLVSWYDELNNEYYNLKAIIKSLTSINDNTVRLTAVWEPTGIEGQTYVISYFDSDKTMLSQLEIKNSDDKVELLIPKKEGYDFVCWTYKDSYDVFFELEAYDFDTLFDSTLHARALYATWQAIEYKVTFVSLGNPIVSNRNIENYSTFVLPDNLAAPTRLGYKVEWIIPEFNCSDVVVYPTYIPIEYQVVYSLDGVTAYDKQTVAYDNTTEKFAEALHSEGKVFVGWEVNGTVYEAGSVIPNLTSEVGEVTATACWRGYEIVFVNQSGEVLSKTAKSDSLLSQLEAGAALPNVMDVPERTGYSIGWDIVDTSGDVTVMITYTPVNCTVTYSNGDSEPVKVTVAYGMDSRVITPSDKQGYKFVGWRDCNEIIYAVGSVINPADYETRNIELTAEWEAITYFVKYDLNYETDEQLRCQSVAYNNSTVKFADMKRDGYILKGWKHNENIYNVNELILPFTDIEEEIIVLKAVWEKISYTVKFYADYADTSTFTTISATYDEPFELPINASKNGYKLIGWEINGKAYYFNGESKLEVGNLTCENGAILSAVALWEAKEFIINYHTSATTCVTLYWSLDKGLYAKDNDVITATKEPNLNSDYYWSLSKSNYSPFTLSLNLFEANDGSYYEEIDVYSVYYIDNQYKNVIVDYDNASVKKSYKIELDASNNANCSIALDPTPVKAGYEGGWFFYVEGVDGVWDYVTENGEYKIEDNKLIFNTSGTDTITIYLTSKYTPITYNVELNLAGDNSSEGEDSKTLTLTDISYGQSYVLPEVKREGYNLVGWRLSNDNLSIVEKPDGAYYVTNLTTKKGATVKLVAVWKPIMYKINFYDGINSLSINNKDAYYGQEIILDVVVPRDGYIFNCWVDDNNHTYLYNETVSNLSSTSGTEVHLTALWTPITYTVQYVSDGEVVGENLVAYNAAIPQPSALNKVGYKVDYWSLDITLQNSLDFSRPLTKENGAVVQVYAKWVAVEYVVIYDAGEGETDTFSQTITFGNTEIGFASATREGYTLLGWEYNGVTYMAGGIIPDLTYESSEITLQAVWSLNVYTVYFVNSNSEVIAKEQFTVENKHIEYPALPEGCIAWELFEADENFVIIASPVRDKNSVVFYDENNILLAEMEISEVTEENIKAMLPVPDKCGYNGSWTVEINGNNAVAKAVYTPIEYTITFMDWDGESAVGTSVYTVEDYNFRSPAVPEYVCRHNDASHADRYITHWEEVNLTYGDIVIKPVATAKVYHIEFRYFTSNDDYYSANYKTFTAAYTDAEDFILPEINALQFHYEEAYWVNEGKNVTNENLQELLPYSQNGFICTAFYSTNSYYVQYTFIHKEEERILSTVKIQNGISVEEYVPEFPTGYVFGYWYMEVDGKEVKVVFDNAVGEEKLINSLTTETLSEDNPFILLTKWTPITYIVNYDANGGSYTPDPQEVTYDTDNQTVAGAISRTGYIFKGWKSSLNDVVYQSGDKIYNWTDVGGTTITLTAQWTPITYWVTYDANGGSSTPGSHTVTYDTDNQTVRGAISKTGYTFSGWKSSLDGKIYQPGKIIYNWTDKDCYTKDNPIKLTAQWSVNQYKVSISQNHVTITLYNYNDTSITYGNGAYIDYGTRLKLTWSTNSGYKNGWCKVDGTSYSSGKDFYVSNNNISITSGAEEDSCFIKGTLLSLADGTAKAVEDLCYGDTILAFDHSIGEYVESQIIFIHCTYDYSDFVKLNFINGTSITFDNYGHGLFDTTLNEYVLVNTKNVREYVGHNFLYASYIDGQWRSEEVQLQSYSVYYDTVERYEVITEKTLNHVANGLLACSDALVPICNMFEFGEGAVYDEKQMLEDIATYGLYTYEEWREYVSYEDFEKFNGAYFKIAVEKGLVTVDYLFALINDLELNWIQ